MDTISHQEPHRKPLARDAPEPEEVTAQVVRDLLRSRGDVARARVQVAHAAAAEQIARIYARANQADPAAAETAREAGRRHREARLDRHRARQAQTALLTHAVTTTPLTHRRIAVLAGVGHNRVGELARGAGATS